MPNASEVHVDAALSNFSVKYTNGLFVADQIAPTVPVMKQSDVYYIIDAVRRSLRDVDVARAPGSHANREDFNYTQATYNALDHALEGVVPDEIIANSDSALSAEIDKVQFLLNLIALNKEINLVTKLGAASTNTSAAANVWSDQVNGTPIEDIEEAIQLIIDDVQIRPNTMTLDQKVFTALKNHPDIVDRVSSGGTNDSPAKVNANAIAAIFDLQQVLVAGSFKNTAAQDTTPVTTPVWGTTAWLGYVDPNPGLQTLTGAATFQWNMPGSSGGFIVDRWRDDRAKSNVVRAQRYYDQKIVTATAFCSITSAIS